MSVVGIDLGTTNTVAACVRSGKVHVLADEHGQRLLPSVVSFHPNGEVLVGPAARARRVIDPRNTVYSHKRLIGRSWGSPEIVQAKQRFAFELREGPGQGPIVHARGQDYTLPEISAFVLKRARQIAETALGTPVDRAVITVPAHFNELQRASTKVAGRVSGLEVLRILNEPTAAALAYGLGRTGNERVAVYDFGGGTFDCTLLDLSGNVFEVLATAGDSFLGGDDVDGLIAERMAEAFLKAHRIDPRTDPIMLERLKTSAEEMKVQLSTAETHTVVLKDVAHGIGGSSIHFTFTMSRRDLEAAITPLVDRSFKVTQDALALARLTPTSFDKVILVGGSTRIPLVRKRVEAFFGAPPLDRVNPDEVVAIGAAIQAAALTDGQKKARIPAPPPVPSATRTSAAPSDGDPTATTHLGPPSRPALGVAPVTKAGPPPSRPGGVPIAPPRGPISRPAGIPTAGGATIRKVTAPGVTPPTQPMGARSPAQDDAFGGFGAVDEPQSLVSNPSMSFPSFPSDPGAPGGAPRGAAGMPSPVGEPDAFETAERSHVEEPRASRPGATSLGRPSTAGEFGHIKDLSLISSTGTSSPDVAGGARSSQGAFGQIKDLSIVSTSSETKDLDAITEARRHALDAGTFGFDDGDDTAAMVTGRDAAPGTSPMRGPAALQPVPDEAADLPAVVPTADLPAYARGKAPPVRRSQPSSPGMGPGGGSSMLGKPPPLMAPQPFGPMERVDEPGPASRTAAMPPRAPAPAARIGALGGAPGNASPRPPPGPNTTAPMQARANPPPSRPPGAPPSRPPPVPAVAAPSAPLAATLASPMAPTPFGSAPPPPPPAHHVTAPMNAPPGIQHGSGPYAAMPGAGHAGPGGSGAYGSQPPGAYGSQPPAAYGSQPPPMFGAYPSSPPGAGSEPPLGGGMPFEGRVPHAPAPPRNVGFAAPVLVDVTPRALVVETAGGYTDTIIARNAKIPCERTRRFATGRDMQTTVRVRVAQGEHGTFPQNTYLGEVELSGLRAAPRGEVVVAVTFEVDADGTLRVRARDVQTGQEARATLTLVGVADESSVVMMINRFAQQPVTGGGPSGPAH